MIISKTPLRVSFFGGGTDIPRYYEKYGGRVISTTIDKYLYVTLKTQSEFFNEKYRLNYFNTEVTSTIKDIKNETIRETLKYKKTKEKLYISTISDIPSGSGLGSSSSFCVGLIKVINFLKGKVQSDYQIAKSACEIELSKMKKPIGIQDQFAVSIGGINYLKFKEGFNPEVSKIKLKDNFLKEFQNSMVLIWTGKSRNANNVLDNQLKYLEQNSVYYEKLNSLTKEAFKLFKKNNFDQKTFSKLLNENWRLKQQLSNKITNKNIKSFFSVIEEFGDCGAKICGAGNGGFILLCYNNNKNLKLILSKLKNPLYFPLKLSFNSSNIIFTE